MPRRSVFLAVLSVMVFTLCLPSAQARRDEIENPERLQFLRQATGSTPSSSSQSTSFQSRLSAIMDTSASTERYSVAAEEAQERKQVYAELQEELAEEELPPDNKTNNSLKKQDQKKVSNTMTKTKLDGSDRSFQKERDKIQEEFDQRLKKTAEPSPAASAAPSDLLKETGTLAPSLANNPFYNAPEGSGNDQARFADRKPVIASRLSGVLNISAQEAEDMVSGTSNPEELVLRLMQDYGVTYGEASDMTS